MAAELTFEQALAELEKIVARLEGGQLSLEDAMAAHKRGLELAKQCQARLEKARQEVRILEGDVLQPFPRDPAGAEPPNGDSSDRDD